RLQWANGTLAEMTGQAPSLQLGRPLSELWPGLAPALSPLCTRALAGEAIQGVAVTDAPERASANGEARHLRISLLPAVSGGLLSGLTLLLQDDTARVREEELLRESELRLKTLADLSCDGYLLLDRGT